MAWTTRTGFGVYSSALTHPMGWIGVGTVWRTRICDWVQVNIPKSRSLCYRPGAFPTLSRACTRALRSFPLRLACRKSGLPLGAQKSGYLGTFFFFTYLKKFAASRRSTKFKYFELFEGNMRLRCQNVEQIYTNLPIFLWKLYRFDQYFRKILDKALKILVNLSHIFVPNQKNWQPI